MICGICGKECNLYSGLSRHLYHTHDNFDKERYYNLFVGGESHICPTCGNPTPFQSISAGYLKFCSHKCAAIFNAEESVRKALVTKSNYTDEQKEARRNKVKKTWSEKDLSTIDFNEANKKRKKTCLEKYGVENVLLLESSRMASNSKEVRRKMAITCKQTCLEKYGVENVFQNEYIKEKSRITMNIKYGVDYARNRMANSSTKRGILYRETGYNSFVEYNFSKELDKLHISYIHNYREDEFECDFYLTDLNIYVALQLFPSHGGKPFTNSGEDKKVLEKWKSHSQYNTWKRVWTISDVRKRKVAKLNGYNYVELWNKKDIERFLNKLREG